MHVAGYGTDGLGRAVTPRTPFRIGSLTKSFTAAAVLQLVESGHVNLDTPAQTYLPDFTLADAEVSRRITVCHLLNQTSGIADAGFPAVTDPEPDLGRRVAGLRGARHLRSTRRLAAASSNARAAAGVETVGVRSCSNTPERSLTLSAPKTRMGRVTPASRSDTPSSKRCVA